MTEPNQPYPPGPPYADPGAQSPYPGAPAAGQQQWQAPPPAPPGPWPGPAPQPQQYGPAPVGGQAPRTDRSSTRRRLLTAAGAGIPVLAAGGYVVSRLGSTNTSSNTTGGGSGYDPGNYNPSTLPSAAGDLNGITTSTVTAMLAKANSALASRDQNAYTALFTGSAATQAARIFKNLGKFQFSFAEYQLIGAQTRQFDTGSTASVDMDIAFVHQVTDVDRDQVAEWYRWTIVKDGSGSPIVSKITGSPSINASAKFTYFPMPWDSSTDVKVIKRGRAVVCAEAPYASAVELWADTLAAAVQDNRDEWAAAGGPGGIAPGALYMLGPGSQLYYWWAGNANAAGHEAGLTTGMVSPKWLADPGSTVLTIAGARISLNLDSQFFTKNRGSLSVRSLARHEDTHNMLFTLLTAEDDTVPLLIVEGYADYKATCDYTSAVQTYFRDDDIRSYAKGINTNGAKWGGGFPSKDEIYNGNATVSSGAYGLSAMLFYYIASLHGPAAAVKLLVANYEAASPDGIAQGKDNLGAAIQSALGISQTQLQAGWSDFLKQQLGVQI